MASRIFSLNVGNIQTVSHRGSPVPTGIFKSPVTGARCLQRETLVGDHQVDRRFHGGVDKAVYCYPWEHYAYWQESLRRSDLRPGHFGENFTTEGLQETEVCIGDCFRVGTAEVEVTQPRVPCFKLGIRMGNPAFVRHFLESRRVGFYLRVLKEGEVEAGNTMTRIKGGETGLSISEVLRLRFFDTGDVNGIQRALLENALSAAWREELAALLQGRED